MGHEGKSDSELVDAFLEGDEKAFSHIFARHRSRLVTAARKFTANESDAHDVVQEAFLKASTSLDGYRGEAMLGTWLYRLVLNSGYDFAHHRANRQHPSIDNGVVDIEQSRALSYDITEALEAKLVINAALEQLSEEQRRCIELTELQGLTIADAAAAEGVATGTIKSRRARARETLRAALHSA